MKKTGLLTAFAAAVCFSLAAQQQDIIDATELTFRSQLEQDILTAHFKKEKTDPFLLFMASGSILPDAKVKESRNQFETHLEQYNDEKIKSKKNDKKTKYIYDGLHRHFLKKYEELATFEQVFYNGSYNCVSASALYALAFQKLGIPFVIKEEPTHVYLVAFPDADRVKIETTSPVGGFQAMTSNFKQSYVKSLRDQKLISQQEASSRSTDELFDKYYFNNQQNVSLENLAGIQYMNEAVENMENRKFNEATIAMEKAYLLFPTPRTGYLLMTAYSQAFDNRNEKDSLHAIYLGKLSRFKDAGVTRDVVRGEFARALNVLLFEQNKKEHKGSGPDNYIGGLFFELVKIAKRNCRSTKQRLQKNRSG